MNVATLAITDTVWLCGHFSTTEKTQTQFITSDNTEWHLLIPSAEEQAHLGNFYYPEMRQFILSACRHYTRTVRQSVMLGGPSPVLIEKLDIYLLPMHIAVFTVEIHLTNVPLKDALYDLFSMRTVERFVQPELQPYVQLAIRPVDELYRRLTGTNPAQNDYAHLVESGNKLKIFHITEIPELQEEDVNNCLYSLGTLAVHDPSDPYASSDRYVQSVLDNGLVDVFKNWRALFLLDTASMVTRGEMKPWMKEAWRTHYFEQIYLYELYRTVFLYRLNSEFRYRRRPVKQLLKELDHFERNYSFHTISYNFLPNVIASAIERNIGVEKESEWIKQQVGKAAQTQMEHTEQQQNYFLTFLTIMASFSAVWDIACLTDTLLPFGEIFAIPTVGYRLVASLLLLVIALAALLSRKKS